MKTVPVQIETPTPGKPDLDTLDQLCNKLAALFNMCEAFAQQRDSFEVHCGLDPFAPRSHDNNAGFGTWLLLADIQNKLLKVAKAEEVTREELWEVFGEADLWLTLALSQVACLKQFSMTDACGSALDRLAYFMRLEIHAALKNVDALVAIKNKVKQPKAA